MICPRCRTPDPECMRRSPEKGDWEIYLCGTCYYCWRTSEPQEVVDAELYDERYRIDPKDIENFIEFPRVPPLAKAPGK